MSRYSREEVQALIEGYAEWRELKSTTKAGLNILVKLADLDRAIKHMPPKEYQAVLLHGLLAGHVEDAAPILGVSRPTVYRRYETGVRWLTDYLNGDAEE